jgi:hypothetical protein
VPRRFVDIGTELYNQASNNIKVATDRSHEQRNGSAFPCLADVSSKLVYQKANHIQVAALSGDD